MEEEEDSVHAVCQIQQQGDRERELKKTPGPVSVKDRDCKPVQAFRGEKYYKKGEH